MLRSFGLGHTLRMRFPGLRGLLSCALLALRQWSSPRQDPARDGRKRPDLTELPRQSVARVRLLKRKEEQKSYKKCAVDDPIPRRSPVKNSSALHEPSAPEKHRPLKESPHPACQSAYGPPWDGAREFPTRGSGQAKRARAVSENAGTS